MKKYLLALGAVAALANMPCMAQSDSMTTNVDTSRVRADLDKLRDTLDRIQENDALSFAAGDSIDGDRYRRMNDGLLDDATALSALALKSLGPAANIPSGWGEARLRTQLVASDLADARLRVDYYTPISKAKWQLKKAYEAMDRSSGSGMSSYSSTTTGSNFMSSSGSMSGAGSSAAGSGMSGDNSSVAPMAPMAPDTSMNPPAPPAPVAPSDMAPTTPDNPVTTPPDTMTPPAVPDNPATPAPVNPPASAVSPQ